MTSRPKRRFKKRFVFGLPLALIGLVAGFCVLANHWVVTSAEPYIYTQIEALPVKRVGVVLGTSTFTKTGQNNLLFDYRMAAAVDLYLSLIHI